jgi:hypothetical protein
MLVAATDEIACNTDVKYAVTSIGHYVNKASL